MDKIAGLHDIEQLRLSFSMVITRRRTRNGWSQSDMAGFSGLERSYISRLEKGQRTPTLDVVFRFAEAFGVSPLTLMKEILNVLNQED